MCSSGLLILIILLGLLFDAIIVAMGFVISLYAPNSLQVTRYLMLLSIPIFVISGYSWPSTHIPLFINRLAQLMPYTWMSEGFRLVTVKNLGADYLVVPIMVLTVMAAVLSYFALTFSERRYPSAQVGVTVNSSINYPKKDF